MKLRVGLIGLGSSWQNRHAPLLRALADRIEVRGVCEQVSHRAEQAAAEFNARCFHGFRALILAEDIDAVLMLAPQWYGQLPILAACDAGKAVYCAVALNIDLETAYKLKKRVEQAGIAFMAELPKRHAPATLRLKELIATQLGPPRLIFCHQRLLVEENQDPQPRRGMPMHNMVELVDWCRFIVDREPTSVTGVAHQAGSGPYETDYEMFSLQFAAGEGNNALPVTAQLSCGHYLPTSWPEAISFRPPTAMQVACERGVAFIDFPSTVTWFDGAGRHRESLESDRPVGEQLLSHFVRAVTSLVRRQSDLDDAYRSMAIVLAGRESESEGRRIELDG
jgi:predicted dehydrogenase